MDRRQPGLGLPGRPFDCRRSGTTSDWAEPMMTNFATEETWSGGHYEIEIELGVSSDERLGRALDRIWSHPSLQGCCFSRDQEPQAQVRVIPGQHRLEDPLYGLAGLPNGATAACGTYVCRLQSEGGQPARDLLSFYTPLGSLARAYDIGKYPFADHERAAQWRPEVDRWLVELGRFVFERVEFDLALVGWEVDFPRTSAESVKRSGVPAERFDGYLWRAGPGLEWHQATKPGVIRLRR